MNPFYGLVKKLLQSNFARLPSPCKITFAITYACTYLCKTCNIGRNYLSDPQGTRRGELEIEDIGKIFQSAKPSWVQITGGEPFMKDMVAILKILREADEELYAVHTTTNAYAVDRIVGQVEKILALRIPRFAVSVSVDGFKGAHEEIRGMENSFDRCLDTFHALQKLESDRFNVFLSYTSSRFNRGGVDGFIRQMEEMHGIDPKYVHLNLYHTSDHFFKNTTNGGLLRDQTEALVDLASYRKVKKGNDFKVNFMEQRYSVLAEEFLRTGKSPLPCKALNASCFLDPYGNVFPCMVWGKRLGDLRDFDFDLRKLWNEGEVLKTQQDAESLNCPNCWTPCEAYQTIAGNLRQTLLV